MFSFFWGWGQIKGDFFSESVIRFSNLPISKKIFQKTILSLKFKFPAYNALLLLAGNSNLKFRVVFRNIFLEIWRFEKHIALSEKNPPLQQDLKMVSWAHYELIVKGEESCYCALASHFIYTLFVLTRIFETNY